jgi:hypothetical protein
MSSNLMEKILNVWRIWLGRSSQSFAIPIPLVFLSYESKEALKGTTSKVMGSSRKFFSSPEATLRVMESQRFYLAARNHSIESDNTMAELGLGEAKLGECFRVHDVQATAAIHKALGELIALNHGVVSFRDELWMIVTAPLHRCL